MKVKINGKELSLDKIDFDFFFNPSLSNNDNIIAWTWDPWSCLDIYLDNFCKQASKVSKPSKVESDELSSYTSKEVNENG